MIKLSKRWNRIELSLTALQLGPKDLCIVITGGEPHLGAVTVAHRDSRVDNIAIGDHMEHILTSKIGKTLNHELAGSAVICCGIHFDHITKQEIEDIMRLTDHLVKELYRQLKAKIGEETQ